MLSIISPDFVWGGTHYPHWVPSEKKVPNLHTYHTKNIDLSKLKHQKFESFEIGLVS